MKRLQASLFNVFQQLTARSTGLLIIEILVKVGYQRLKAGLSTDERDPAYRFWYALQGVSGFHFETCSRPFAEGNLELSDSETLQQSDSILAEFQEMTFEESLHELVAASYDWLSCCRFEQYKQKNESDQDAKQRFCRDLADALGVY